MATIQTITYIPATKTIQAVVSFTHEGNPMTTIARVENIEETEIERDITLIEEDEDFQSVVESSIQAKIFQIENPELLP